MHELAIAQRIVEAALSACVHAQAGRAQAGRRGASRIVRICCRIGCLRQVEKSLLTDAFDLAKAGTAAADAALTLASVGMLLDCSSCRAKVALEGWQFECPVCRSTAIELSGGDELELTSLELEAPDDD